MTCMLRASANSTDPSRDAGSHPFQLPGPDDAWPRYRSRALLYVKIRAASTQGMKAMACILVLWPTWIICRLYEQKVIATAPPIARSQFTPIDSISRKDPSRDTNRKLAGLAPDIRVS